MMNAWWLALIVPGAAAIGMAFTAILAAGGNSDDILDAWHAGMKHGIETTDAALTSMAKRAEDAENEAARLRATVRANVLTVDCMVARLNEAELEARHLRVMAGMEGVE
jgi:hypothetical protein